MIQSELNCDTRPEIMDDIEYGIKQWVFIKIDWQIHMNPLKEATKAKKDLDKEQKKKNNTNH